MRQLREQYESTKGELSKWTELGEHEEVSTALKHYSAQRNMALEIGTELGYDEEEILDAFNSDPYRTITFLQGKQAESAPAENDRPKLDPETRRKLEEHDKLLKDFKSERAQAKIEKASNLYDAEYHRLYKEAFPDGVPDDVASFLYDITTEMLSYDPKALDRIRDEGKVSDVAKYFNQARERWLKAVNAWGAHQLKRTGGRGLKEQAGEPEKKITLDDIIEDPSVLGPQYAENA
jgi:hypothetical protein